ncbi:Ppx/GppA phosphatase family protein [Dialister sp.]|uniref:Ppx/GppA phosphatase family protein n=1 Tax=Dialister sp. TaxID=1955814 RepID=UPI002E80C7FA|nr:Ppx/GppA phosphatase family protein [Dialister sp.]MEE3453065.1 Ppx/GppA phosphatase family protein [Dialister sp.]
MERIAIIDLGSNSIRFVIMQIGPHGSYKLVYQEKKSIRLAEGMTMETRLLTEEAQQRALSCLKVYAHIIKVQKVIKVLAVATAAVRNAVNGASFLRRVRLSTGIPMTIISGKAEAALGFSGVIHTIDRKDFLLFDLGGASVEISLVRNKQRIHSVSIPMGAVTLTEMFQSSGTVDYDKISEIRDYIQRQLNKISWLPKEPMEVIGVGGTVRNLAKVHQRSSSYPLPKLHNYNLPVESLFTLVKSICDKTYEERKRISGLSEERADIIIAGALVVQEIVRRAKASYLTISGCGLREGLFFHYYDPIYDPEGTWKEDMLIRSVKNYLYTLPIQYDFHTSYVTAMALSMFDQWQKVHGLGGRMRKILTAAGFLHDTGSIVNYYSHARHSAYITANAHIFGWSHREQIMCALVCAFHHGYSNKYLKGASHARILTEVQMKEVRMLSLFLALAEGFDESHEQCITRMICTSGKNAMDLRIYTNRENFDVPAHAVQHLIPEFRKIFQVPLRIQWFPGSTIKNEMKETAEGLEFDISGEKTE